MECSYINNNKIFAFIIGAGVKKNKHILQSHETRKRFLRTNSFLIRNSDYFNKKLPMNSLGLNKIFFFPLNAKYFDKKLLQHIFWMSHRVHIFLVLRKKNFFL